MGVGVVGVGVVGVGVVGVGVVGVGVVGVGVVGAGVVLPPEPPPQPTFNDRIAINNSARLSFIVTSKFSADKCPVTSDDFLRPSVIMHGRHSSLKPLPRKMPGVRIIQ